MNCPYQGHDSIAIFRVHDLPHPGALSKTCERHVRGCTPRHFAFDASGQWLIAANQDRGRTERPHPQKSDFIHVISLNCSD